MSVKLEKLYQEIYHTYDVKLETESCFDKEISWLHMIDNFEFAPLLHGDELVFNSSINNASLEERLAYIDQLLAVEAGGLIVSLQPGHEFSKKLIEYCNQHRFPLFSTAWRTPFINIMRRFSEMLIDSERQEMNLIAGFKNAIHHPEDTSLYLNYLQELGFDNTLKYVCCILSYEGSTLENDLDGQKQLLKTLSHAPGESITIEEKNTFVILTSVESSKLLKKDFLSLLQTHPGLHLAIGSTEHEVIHIYRSYHNAKITLELIQNGTLDNPYFYNDIGSYQILMNLKDPDIIFPKFVEDTLGPLMEYDKTNRTKYMTVLQDFFDNDCSITQTANATFYHQNTLKYKIKNIKEILGYDIMANEHRVKIMLSLYILKISA